MLDKINKLLNKRFDMEAIAEAKKADEVDQISDFGDSDSGETGTVSTRQEA